MNIRSYFILPLVALALPVVASAAVINLDFGASSGVSTYSGSTWNRVNGQVIITTPQALVDSANAATGITLTSTMAMQYTYDAAQTFTGLPATVAANTLFGHNTASTTPSFIFSDLDADYTYTFSVYAVRRTRTDIASGLYTATGENVESGVVNASQNTSTVLTLTNIRPDETGSITFSMMKDVTNNSVTGTGTPGGYFYINALKIETTYAPVPEPSTYAVLLGLGSLAFVAIRRVRANRNLK